MLSSLVTLAPVHDEPTLVAQIEDLLAQLPDQRSVRFDFAWGPDGYSVSAIMILPTGRLTAETDMPLRNPREAIEQVVTKLAKMVYQHS